VLSQEERTVLAPPDQLLWHGISVLGRRQQARQKTCPAAHALLILATLLLLASCELPEPNAFAPRMRKKL